MSEIDPKSLQDCFKDLPDPRVEGKCDHKLIDMIVITVCAVLCGAEGWTGVETFGKSKETWLRSFLDLEHGIPTHDTLGRVFARVEAEAFQTRFARWMEQVMTRTSGQVVAMDGKTLRRSHDRTIGRDAIHMVSAWASGNGMVLGQRKVDDKSNEITAIPELLRLLDVSGCIVTIDAMGCQKAIAQTIRDEKADYVLRVKDNQSKLKQDINDWFAYGDQQQFADMHMDYHETIEKSRGRIEIRRYWAIADPLAFEYIRHHEGWADLNTIIRVERERRLPDKTTYETAYYISSLPADAMRLRAATRHHWAIENSFHRVLDVTFNEDASRIRSGDAAQNMAVFRALALNLLKKDDSKDSLKQKRFRAALDEDFLFSLISQV
ncbi:MAG: ISAs1 family transposase [Chloroflexota bacterium]